MEEAQARECSWSKNHTINDVKLFCPRSCELDASQNKKDSAKNLHTSKRARLDSSAGSGTKACREKMRRDRLNDRFMELHSMLKRGSSQNSNKVAILSCATHLLNQLRLEARKLKDKNRSLQQLINSLKDEKIKLRDEKLMLKAEKERMEQKVKSISVPYSFAPYTASFFSSATPGKPLLHPTYMP